MTDLFVSYSSNDREYVRLIVNELESQGWNVWWDRDIETGASFDQRIEEALETSRCVVVVWSSSSIKSDWVRAEAAEGLERNILIPLLLDDVKPPLLFRQKQAISLVEWKRSGRDSEALQTLMPRISAVLRSYSGSGLPVSTQKSWALGPVVDNVGDDVLLGGFDAGLTVALNFLENAFLYTARYSFDSGGGPLPEQLSNLVDEEGLDGYIYAELSTSSEGTVACIVVQTTDERIEKSILIEDPERLPVQLAEAIVSLAEVLQNSPPAQKDRFLYSLAE